MGLHSISCGKSGSVDRVAFSRSGLHLVTVAAPDSSLRILDSKNGRPVKSVSARQVTSACLRTPGRRPANDSTTEVLFHTRKTGIIQRYSLTTRKALAPLRMTNDYDVSVLVESPDGRYIAAGDEHGNLCVFDLESENSAQAILQHTAPSVMRALAFSADSRDLFIAYANRQIRLCLADNSAEALSNDVDWHAYSISAHPTKSAFAIAGDGNRVWLIDLPFKLNADDEDVAGDGFPLSEWEFDDRPDIAEDLALRKRISLPAVEAERCSYIDSDAGDSISYVGLTESWQLVIVGSSALEVWNLSPFKLLRYERLAGPPAWHPAASCMVDGRLLIAHET